MTAMQELLHHARIYAHTYDPEHAQIRPEFIVAALPELSGKACQRFVELIGDEIPNFWPLYRTCVSAYYKEAYCNIVRRLEEQKFGDLGQIKPDNITEQLMKRADEAWLKHAEIVRIPTPVDYLFAEILMLYGDLDILDLALADCGVGRDELLAYLAGCSRYLTNKYMNINLGMRNFIGIDEMASWANADVVKPAKKAQTKKAKAPEGLADSITNIEQSLRKRVIGQNAAITAVVRALKITEAGLKDPVKPIAVLLFAGPTGVGKTELARATAEATSRPIQRYDMSEYQEPHSVMRLFGAPPSYVGYDEGGQLTKFVNSNPKGIVVFDEAEKAHPDVLNALLQIAEEGTLTDGKGKKVSFAETIVFITTNIGAKEASRRAVGFASGEMSRTHTFKTALEKFFRPELRGRLTDTIIFEPLLPDEILRIADLELAKIGKRLLENRSIELKFTEAVKVNIAQQSDTLQYGARNIKTVIASLIAAPLSDFIVASKLPNKALIQVGVDENENITFNAPPHANRKQA